MWRAILTAPAIVLMPGLVFASGCINPVVVPIKFPKGGMCWSFEGVGTEFVGKFQAGQKVTITAKGDFPSVGPSGTETSFPPWHISVSGPNTFSKSAPDSTPGRLSFFTSTGGEYHFNLFPCAIWGSRGTVSICTQKMEPRAAALEECLAQPELRLGMTPDEVINSRWGKPYDRNTTITAAGRREQWIYKDYVSEDGCNRIYDSSRMRFLYFENGRLVAIQR